MFWALPAVDARVPTGPSASGIWPAAATPGYNMPPSRDHVVRDRTPLLRSSVPCGPPVAPHRLPPLSLRSELPQPGRLGCSCIRSGGPATLRRPPAGVAVALLVASRWVSLGAFARRFAYRHHFPHRHRPQSPQGGSLGPLALSEVSLPWRNSPRCQGPPGPRHQRLTGARTPEIARLRPISSGNPREPRRRPSRLLGPNFSCVVLFNAPPAIPYWRYSREADSVTALIENKPDSQKYNFYW